MTAATGRAALAVERFLVKKIRRTSTMVESSPKLTGDISRDEAEGFDDDAAWHRIRLMRWPDRAGEPKCPKCGDEHAYTFAARRVFRCSSCKHTFSAVSGTVFAGFKGGYAALARRIAYAGPINDADTMQSKTALDVRRRNEANDRR